MQGALPVATLTILSVWGPALEWILLVIGWLLGWHPPMRFESVPEDCETWATTAAISLMNNQMVCNFSRRKTTHVIASNLPHAKRKDLQPGQKIVKPQWITDSLKAKRLLPIDDYFVVPIEDGAQNRITSMFEKNRSSGSHLSHLITMFEKFNEIFWGRCRSVSG